MKNEKMVTRTISTLYVDAMTLNVETAEVCTYSFTAPLKLKDNPRSILTYLRLHNETDTLKIASIVSTEVRTALMGMPESVFIEHATILPPRTTNE